MCNEFTFSPIFAQAHHRPAASIPYAGARVGADARARSAATPPNISLSDISPGSRIPGIGTSASSGIRRKGKCREACDLAEDWESSAIMTMRLDIISMQIHKVKGALRDIIRTDWSRSRGTRSGQ